MSDSFRCSSAAIGSLLLLLSLRVQTASSIETRVPEILSSIQDANKWQVIKSTQTVSKPGKPKEVYQIEDYFNIHERATYSRRRDVVLGVTELILSKGGRTYMIDEGNARCELDLRHHHTTMWPWRGRTSRYSMTAVSSTVLGVPGLWLNAIEKEAACEQDKAGHSVCSFENSNHKAHARLTFQEPLRVSGSNMLSALVSASVSQNCTVESADDGLMMLDIQTKLVVDSSANIMEANSVEGFNEQFKLCEESNAHVVLFPSLARVLATSEQRNYFAKYKMTLTRVRDGIRSVFLEEHTMTEWFSYELESQVFTREIGLGDVRELFYRPMNLRDIKTGLTAFYRVCKSPATRENCRPYNPDLFVFGGWDFAWRRMHFILQEEEYGPIYHSGTIAGLGALLMNTADIQHKQLVSIEHGNQPAAGPAGSSKKASDSFKWVVRGHKPGEKVYFHFTSVKTNEHGEKDLTTLSAITMHKLVPENGSADPSELFADPTANRLVLRIDIQEFRTHLREDEFQEITKTLPHFCPRNGYEDSLDKPPKTHQLPPPATMEDDFDMPYEFPSFYEHLELSRDYVIDSIWTSEMVKQSLEVTEYFMFDGKSNLGDNEHYHFARLDIKEFRETGLDQYKYFVAYKTSTAVRVDHHSCIERAPADSEWISHFSAEFKLGQLADADSERAPLRHYGVGGLWALGSRSPLVEYMGEFAQSDGGRYTLWHLFGDSELKRGLSITFNFTQLATDEPNRFRYKLNSIQVIDRYYEPWVIKPSETRIGRAGYVHFILPPLCNERVDYFQRMPEFPTFLHVFGGQPSDVHFKFFYDLNLQYEQSMAVFSVTEANKVDPRGYGLISIGVAPTHRIWVTPDGQALFEKPESKQFRPISSLSNLMMLSDLEDVIIDGKHDIGKHRSSFPLANIWNLLSSRASLSESRLISSVRHINLGEERIRCFAWSLDDGKQNISIEFKHLHERDQLELHRVEFVRHGSKNHIFFDVKSSSKDSSDRPLFEYPEENCNIIGSNGQFPRIENLFEREDVINMRSEVIRDKQDTRELERFLLDEWMQVGQSFRTKVKVVNGAGQSKDYLIYNKTNEFFDLSKEFLCPQVAPISEPKLGISPLDPISDSLFEREDQIAFYGPLAMWTLASRRTMRTKLISPEMNLLRLKYRSLLESWFSSDRWLVSHPTKDSLRFQMLFKLDQVIEGKNVILIDRIEASNWHVLSQRGASSAEQRIAINIIHRSDFKPSQEGDNERPWLVDKFLIPVGYGCKRGVSDQKELSGGFNDALIFDPSMTLEFEYQASLRVRDGPDGTLALTPRPVFISGHYARCPNTWNRQTYGGLEVDSQHRHYVNGSITSQTHFICKETPGGQSSEHRLLNHVTGSCSIWRETQQRSGVIQLDFGPSYKVKIAGDWIFFVATSQDQRVQYLRGSRANRWRDKVVYESRESTLRLLDNMTGPASIVRTFERDDDGQEIYGHTYHHSSVELDIYMSSGSAHLNVQIRNLRRTNCYEVLKKSVPKKTCHESTQAKLSALSDSDWKVRFRVLRFEFQPSSSNSDYYDFESSRMSIEQTIVNSLLNLEPGLLDALQIGHVNLQTSQQDKIVADVRLYALAPPADRFGQLAGMALGKTPVMGTIRFVNSMHSCSSICESGENCLAFSYCPNKECQVLNYDYWTHAFPDLGDPSEKNLVESLQKIVRPAEGCTTFYSPTGQPAMTLQSQIEVLGIKVAQRRLSISLLHYSFQYTAAEMEEIYDTVLNDEFESNPTTTSIFDPIAIDRQISLAKVQSEEYANVHSRMTFADSESACLDLCNVVSCNLFSFCSANRKCVTVGGISSWNVYQKIAQEATETVKSCTLMGRDYLVDYHRFSTTGKPEKYLSLVEDVTQIECATRCHFAGDRLAATDCLSFDFCVATPAKKDGIQSVRGSCYLQKLHVMMDDFEASILNQQTDNNFLGNISSSQMQCNHYSRSLVADYEPLEGRKFINHDPLVLVGNSLDSCALICRRDSACSSFEYCRSQKVTTCHIKKGQKIDMADTTPAKECNIYSVKHFGEDYKVEFNQDGRLTIEVARNQHFRDLMSQSEVFLVGGYLAAALLIGALFGLAFYKLMGYPLRILACT